MGKYMRKARLSRSRDVAVVEFAPHQPSIGVRTRARALIAASATATAAQGSHPLPISNCEVCRLKKTMSPPHSFKPKAAPPRSPKY